LAIYYNAKDFAVSASLAVACFVSALGIFIFYPAPGDQIHIVTGLGRVVFSAASVLMVFSFYKNTRNIPAIVAAPLTHLGVITYGVYLLHPVIYLIVTVAIRKLHIHVVSEMTIGMTLVLTVICAVVSFKLLEQPFIRIGKRLTARPSGRQQPTVDRLAATK
jgi:exopolysaccharide production protein ExoZ